MNLAAADFSQIPMSQSLAATLARASEAAGALGSPDVALEHVLLALCDDADAQAVLVASRVDVARLRTETLGYLGSIQQAPISGGLGVSPGLTRILEAAAAAARGGRRRDINGAIVLAAIVGDGKSAAAQILQAQGLTFDEAIRALQSALAAPSRDAMPDLRPTDDVLAGARARVQSRSAPTLRDMMGQPPPVAMPRQPSIAEAFPRPQAIPAPMPEPKYEAEPQAPASTEPVQPAASSTAAPEPAAAPGPAPAASPAAEQPKAETSYIYPSPERMPQQTPAPVAMPSLQTGHPGNFDFSRPVPIATPPPIPPPIPQQPQNYGVPPQYPFAPAPMREQQMHAPRWDQSPGPFGRPQDGGNSYGDIDAQLGRTPNAPVPQMRAPSPIGGGAAPQQNRGAKPKGETGQLAENIPRSMRVSRTERVEVRIAKSSAKAITEGLEGGGVAWQHDVVVTQAMSVRLRAPEGGFFIETVSPETQWLENHLGFASDEFASWRFLVTPQTRGRTRLQIVVSARTIGADGMAAETALPNQVVEVKVRTNYKRTFGRLLGWIFAAVAGGAFAKFGESGIDIANGVIQKFMH